MLTRRAFVCGAGGLAIAIGLGTCTTHGAGDGDGAGDGAGHPGAALHTVWYHCGGGELGDSDSIELSRVKDGTAVVVRERKESWGDKGRKTTAKPGEAAFDELARIADEHDLREASERPDREEQALDAPTTSVTYAYLGEDGDMDVDGMFTVSDTQDLSDWQLEGFRAACEVLLALAS